MFLYSIWNTFLKSLIKFLVLNNLIPFTIPETAVATWQKKHKNILIYVLHELRLTKQFYLTRKFTWAWDVLKPEDLDFITRRAIRPLTIRSSSLILWRLLWSVNGTKFSYINSIVNINHGNYISLENIIKYQETENILVT